MLNFMLSRSSLFPAFLHRRSLCCGFALLVALLLSLPVMARPYQSFSQVVAGAVKGVVNIRTTQVVKGKDSNLDPYQFFLKGRIPRTSTNHSLGSGVLLDSKGYIATNYHVIKGAAIVEVLLADRKRKHSARVVGVDQKTDLALLKINPRSTRSLRPLSFGDSRLLQIGDRVFAIGNPFGYSHTVTSGIISAKSRVIGTGPYDNFLQTDAAIHPGNSGGPLLDIRGRVIGINTATATDAYGIGFAIPANIVTRVIRDLKSHGKVIRPWLGMIGKNILSGDELGDAYDPSGVYGVLVDNLIVDGPGYQSGLRIGDLILALGRKKIIDLNEMQRVLSMSPPGSTVSLKVFRRGKGYLRIKVRLAVTPKAGLLPDEKDLF